MAFEAFNSNYFTNCVKYTQPEIWHKGSFGWLGIGEEYEVDAEKSMALDKYFNLTSDFINGTKSDDLDNMKFDQESIIEALWREGDADKNNFLDNSEYMDLVGKTLTGTNCFQWGLLHPYSETDCTYGYLKKANSCGCERFQYRYTEKEFEYLDKLKEEYSAYDTDGDGYLSKEEYASCSINSILPVSDKK